MAIFGRETKEDQARADAWALWLKSQNAFAIASVVLGSVSLIEFGVLGLGFFGIAAGIIALRQLKRIAPDEPRNRGHRLAWIGMITSAISLVMAALIYFRLIA